MFTSHELLLTTQMRKCSDIGMPLTRQNDGPCSAVCHSGFKRKHNNWK